MTEIEHLQLFLIHREWVIEEARKWLGRRQSAAKQRALRELSLRAQQFVNEYAKFKSCHG